MSKGSDAYDQAYREVMTRIDRQPPDSTKLAKDVLSWIFYAKRPLTTIELQHALAVEEGESELDEENLTEVEELASVCAGLVTIDKETSIIRLVHYTTQEFFKREQTMWFPEAQARIANTCTTYLAFSAFETGFCGSDADFEERLRLNPLYDYAALHWGHHMRESSIYDPAIEFLQSESKVSAAGQAFMAKYGGYHGYSQTVRRQITGLHLIARFGLVELLGKTVKDEYSLNYKDSYDQTPLFYSVRYGFKRDVSLLLQQKDVAADSKDKNGRTPLSHAAEYGHEEIVKLLVQGEDGEADLKDDYNQTPLSFAAMYGHEEIVRLLLQQDVEAN